MKRFLYAARAPSMVILGALLMLVFGELSYHIQILLLCIAAIGCALFGLYALFMCGWYEYGRRHK